MKHKLLSLFVALTCATSLFASDIQVDGIWYDFNSSTKTASVTYRGSSYSSYEDEYSGSVVIPETVIYNSITYSVTTIGEWAFSYCSNLSSITIPKSVTTIGNYAFATCTGLTSVIIPNSVTTIGMYAFSGCSSLISVTIPNSVTTIERGVFYGCSGLTSIEIPNSVKTIGDYAFYRCSGLTSVTIPNSVTTIGLYAFSGCSSLISVTIPNSVTTIGRETFYGCSGLTSIEIPNSVTTIGEDAFYGCYGLTSVVIPSSVTTIGDHAFNGCSGLTSVTIPNSVTSIGVGAFSNCSGLTSPLYNANCFAYLPTSYSGSYTIPDGIKQIAGGAFAGCTGLTSVTIPNSVTTIGNSAFSGCNSLPITNNLRYADTYLIEAVDKTLSTYTIKDGTKWIGSSAFAYCGSLTSITIPNSVTSIGDAAFFDCSGLTSVTIPNSVTSIGTYAFYCVFNIVYNGTATGSPWGAKFVNGYVDGCFIYKDDTKTTLLRCLPSATGVVTIPSSVTTIFGEAFRDCINITSVTISNSVTSIGDAAFYGCSGLTSVTIPNSVTTIGNSAFYGCTGLTSITIPNSVTMIGHQAFCECDILTSITIPNSVTTIGEYAFAYCRGLTSVIFAEKSQLTTIGNSAFSKCSGLTSVTIPNSVTTIGKSAFYECSSLTSVTIPNSVTEIGYGVFSYCSDLTSVTIPNSVTEIGERAFMDCSSLTSVTIPNSVKTIGEYAFYGCSSLTSITIGNSVTTIGEDAFYGCYGLTSVVIPSSVTTIGNKAFYNVQTITIPNWIKSLGSEWIGASYRSEEKTVYVVISPFEYDNNSQGIETINSYIRKNCGRATLIPQLAEVATWTTTPTTIEMDIDLTNIPTTALYDSISIDYFGEENDIEKILTPSTINHVIFTGLTPNQKANIYYTSKKIGENDWKEGAKLEIQLPKLNLTTLTPKVVSAGTAVVAAETNISDYETNVGFEWRKYDAPESMPSKSGAAILFNGMMEGKLLNLSTDAYWNVRPYYEAADGTRYYGEWITFDPSDFSYFEPTVHTYALATSPTANKVQVRGYVMTGTDDVTEQGFEYWFKGGQKASHRIPNATADSVYRVTASGQVMTAVLEDLAYSSTYTCRAYAIAGGKTYYGEEVQFLTPEDPRPIYTLTVLAGENGSVNAEVSGQYREGEQVTLTATPNVGYLFEQWSDGNTENPYILTIMQDTEITATFKLSESGLTNLHSDIRATKYFHNGNLVIERNGVKYTATGQKVR